MSRRLQILRERAAFAELLSLVGQHNDMIVNKRFEHSPETIAGEWDRTYANVFGGQDVHWNAVMWGSGLVGSSTRWVSERKRSNVCVGYLYAQAFNWFKIGTEWARSSHPSTHRTFNDPEREECKRNINDMFGKLGGGKTGLQLARLLEIELTSMYPDRRKFLQGDFDIKRPNPYEFPPASMCTVQVKAPTPEQMRQVEDDMRLFFDKREQQLNEEAGISD